MQLDKTVWAFFYECSRVHSNDDLFIHIPFQDEIIKPVDTITNIGERKFLHEF